MTTVLLDRVSAAVDGTVVLRDVSFEAADGEFLAVVGRSGSGKTSLIRTIAGFTDVVHGRVYFDGEDVTKVAVAGRDLGMVFQQPVVFPKRSVRRNLSFPLEIRKQDAEEIRQRVDAEVRSMHLEHLLARRPETLSRGEAQLVQIARTMVRSPRVLLLDEPFAGLDAALQASMRSEVAVLQAGYGVTTVMATNDSADALAMASRLVVLDHGELVQIGAPLDVRRDPSTVDAALATGDYSLVGADVERDVDGFWLVAPGHGQATPMRYRAWRASLNDRVGQQVLIGVRPDDVRVVTEGDVQGVVRRPGIGSMGLAQIDVGGCMMVVRTEARLRVSERVDLAVDRVAIFDPDTGRAIP